MYLTVRIAKEADNRKQVYSLTALTFFEVRTMGDHLREERSGIGGLLTCTVLLFRFHSQRLRGQSLTPGSLPLPAAAPGLRIVLLTRLSYC